MENRETDQIAYALLKALGNDMHNISKIKEFVKLSLCVRQPFGQSSYQSTVVRFSLSSLLLVSMLLAFAIMCARK